MGFGRLELHEMIDLGFKEIIGQMNPKLNNFGLVS